MGMFDDLVPATSTAQKSSTGMFDDLVPTDTTDFGGGLPADASPAAYAAQSAQVASSDPTLAPVATPEAMSSVQALAVGEENNRRAALQGVSPYVEDMQPLGQVSAQDDGGGAYFKGVDGTEQEVNASQHMIFRHPGDGALTVYQRDPKFDETRLKSLGRFILPGLITGPVIGIARAVRAADAVTDASRATGAAMAAERVAQGANDLSAFNRAKVAPFGPAFSQGPVAGMAKQLSEVPLVGQPVRNALETSLTDTAGYAKDVAGRLGSADSAQSGGQAIEEAITRFKDARPADIVDDAATNLSDTQIKDVIAGPTRFTSLKTKQAALYERAWRLIPEDMQKGRAVEGVTRVMGNPQNTRAVIEGIVARNLRMTNQAQAAREGTDKVANPVQGGLLGRMIEAVRNPKWTANLQTLRDMRSEFRRLSSGMADTEKNTLKLSDLDRIQGAITRDMVFQLQRNATAYREAGGPDNIKTALGFERSIREFQRADQFTRLSHIRLEAIERLFKADNAEALAKNIMQATLSNGRGNIQMLHTLSRTLRPQEMGDVASFLVSEMGKPVGSARGITQELGFSVSSFLTKWNNMTPEAKQMLFGGSHSQAIDDLVRVVSRLANVEALANTSRSATNAMSVGGLLASGSALASGSWSAALVPGLTGYGAAQIFARPAYARWAVGYARLRAKMLAAPGGAVRATTKAATSPDRQLVAHINRLAEMARANPDLVPVLRNVAEENGIIIPERREKQEQVQDDAGQQ